MYLGQSPATAPQLSAATINNLVASYTSAAGDIDGPNLISSVSFASMMASQKAAKAAGWNGATPPGAWSGWVPAQFAAGYPEGMTWEGRGSKGYWKAATGPGGGFGVDYPFGPARRAVSVVAPGGQIQPAQVRAATADENSPAQPAPAPIAAALAPAATAAPAAAPAAVAPPATAPTYTSAVAAAVLTTPQTAAALTPDQAAQVQAVAAPAAGSAPAVVAPTATKPAGGGWLATAGIAALFLL